MNYDVKDLSLAKKGKDRIVWAGSHMPVLNLIRKDFAKRKPLKGLTIGACLHVTTETANLMTALKAGGADVFLCASNPLSTQDETAASLVKDYGIPTFAIRGVDNEGYYRHIQAVLDAKCDITMDDGADLISTLHRQGGALLKKVIGGTEETTTGVHRLKSMAKEGVLKYPVIAVNEAKTKHLFDNRYGTGQSTMDGIIRATNLLIAGSVVVVAGYGWCGRGVAMRARGLGARVIVTEIDPVKGLEAVMDGFEVMPMIDAAPLGDIFVTLTGNIDIITKLHIPTIKDGAVLANSGHFNVEISLPDLEKAAKAQREARTEVIEYTLADGRKVYLIGEGRLVNLAAAEGHPAAVMDMSFANQALACETIATGYKTMQKDVYVVSEEIDARVATLKLKAMGIGIDVLSKRQKEYLAGWQEGT
jgi:adenosylhomocysteinase